jgi:hypothetical protein
MSNTATVAQALASAKHLITLIERDYGVRGDLIGNGCWHGFKPASSCPSHDCSHKALHDAYIAYELADAAVLASSLQAAKESTNG